MSDPLEIQNDSNIDLTRALQDNFMNDEFDKILQQVDEPTDDSFAQ